MNCSESETVFNLKSCCRSYGRIVHQSICKLPRNYVNLKCTCGTWFSSWEALVCKFSMKVCLRDLPWCSYQRHPWPLHTPLLSILWGIYQPALGLYEQRLLWLALPVPSHYGQIQSLDHPRQMLLSLRLGSRWTWLLQRSNNGMKTKPDSFIFIYFHIFYAVITTFISSINHSINH